MKWITPFKNNKLNFLHHNCLFFLIIIKILQSPQKVTKKLFLFSTNSHFLKKKSFCHQQKFQSNNKNSHRGLKFNILFYYGLEERSSSLFLWEWSNNFLNKFTSTRVKEEKIIISKSFFNRSSMEMMMIVVGGREKNLCWPQGGENNFFK